jgi:hypothetical protein
LTHCFGCHIHCVVEVTESSTNKTTLSLNDGHRRARGVAGQRESACVLTAERAPAKVAVGPVDVAGAADDIWTGHNRPLLRAPPQAATADGRRVTGGLFAPKIGKG